MMLKWSKIAVLLVVLVLSMANMVFASEVPQEAVQLLIDDSTEIQGMYGAGMNYQDWKQGYGKLVRDEAKFSAKYPDNPYKDKIQSLMTYYDMAGQGWYYYIKGTNDAKSKQVIQSGMKLAKDAQNDLIEVLQ
ncbi:hypothetical protein [Pelosinus propionicus]|uniref:Uncharacterized protein n=1 Tax=Pelosinus propionicus DSM 13327 TaxID=1123291 RepID=A0A1I4QG62_9FIRM|nr:hypothetical protein [Pelosinus propionicus]SFM38640.1 hypothetical protein SAMN04490355_109710 [Pelosinus propionicus DSM 13327]